MLTKRNGAVLKVRGSPQRQVPTEILFIQILYAQKYFNSVLPRILEAAGNVTGELADHDDHP